jgi:hypothetical protein
MLRAIRKMDQECPPVMVFSGTIKSADEVRELGTLGVTGYVNEYMAPQHIVPALVPHLFPDSSNRRSSLVSHWVSLSPTGLGTPSPRH